VAAVDVRAPCLPSLDSQEKEEKKEKKKKNPRLFHSSGDGIPSTKKCLCILGHGEFLYDLHKS
jgi:hypothetical protein